MPCRYDNILHLGNCLDGLGSVADDSADIVICDPPYNVGKNFGNNADGMPIQSYISWCAQWIEHCKRIMKPAATMFIYGYAEILAHISVRLPIKKQRWLQWHYTNKNMANLNFWQRSHESILCVWKEKPIFNRDSVREPYTSSSLMNRVGRKRAPTPGRMSGAGSTATLYRAHEKGAMPRDVLKIGALAGGVGRKERNIFCKTCSRLVEPRKKGEHGGHKLVVHPTQKPHELTRRLILSSMPDGEFNILVPFAGSGVECQCALELGGSFMAWEINPDFASLADAVIQKALERAVMCK